MIARPATQNDLTYIFLTSHDTWGEGRPLEQYVNEGLANQKYKKGTWYVLQDDSGKIVTALICYKGAFGMGSNCAGIGSVATLPAARKKGYAEQLVRYAIDQLTAQKVDCIFLYSDVAPSYYEKMGFKSLDAALQKHLPSICMAQTLKTGLRISEVPSYF